MKINEILTAEEIKQSQSFYGMYCLDDIDCKLSNHVIDMELKDYLLYRIVMELEEIKLQGEQYE